MKRFNIQSGFTIVELLVVISIIALLASVVLVNFVSARINAQVTTDKIGLKTENQAFNLYEQDTGDYPPTAWTLNPNVGAAISTCTNSATCSAAGFFTPLVSKGYMNRLPPPPVDPSGNGLWYIHQITDTVNPSVNKNINCQYIGATCGFKAPNTLASCYAASGVIPSNATAKAMLLFWLENGVATDYPASYIATSLGTFIPLGGNALCLY